MPDAQQLNAAMAEIVIAQFCAGRVHHAVWTGESAQVSVEDVKGLQAALSGAYNLLLQIREAQ